MPPDLQRPVVQLPARPLTLADVAELAQADEGYRYELVSGNLLVRPPGDIGHNQLIGRILHWLMSHGYADLTLLGFGLRISEETSGRVPDLLVLREQLSGDTVWADPSGVALVMEVVSPGSEDIDRIDKPREYARAGIPRYWRIERGRGPATVHMSTLGVAADGSPTYLDHEPVLLGKLLAGVPPKLS